MAQAQQREVGRAVDLLTNVVNEAFNKNQYPERPAFDKPLDDAFRLQRLGSLLTFRAAGHMIVSCGFRYDTNRNQIVVVDSTGTLTQHSTLEEVTTRMADLRAGLSKERHTDTTLAVTIGQRSVQRIGNLGVRSAQRIGGLNAETLLTITRETKPAAGEAVVSLALARTMHLGPSGSQEVVEFVQRATLLGGIDRNLTSEPPRVISDEGSVDVSKFVDFDFTPPLDATLHATQWSDLLDEALLSHRVVVQNAP